MKAYLLMLVIVALSTPALASPQDRASTDLNTLLRDASYAFNRFEEVSAGIRNQIGNYPVALRNTEMEALSGIVANVDREKPALNALLGQSKVASADLLDVYRELVEVTSELTSEASNSSIWGNEKFSIDLAQLGANTSLLGAKLAVALRSQIAVQELQLASCRPNTPGR